jgi:hypothetical protein
MNNNHYPFDHCSLFLVPVLLIAPLYLAGCDRAIVPASSRLSDQTATVASALELFSYAEAAARSMDPSARHK